MLFRRGPIDPPIGADQAQVIGGGVVEGRRAGYDLSRGRGGPRAARGRFALATRVVGVGGNRHVGVGPKPVDHVAFDLRVRAGPFLEDGDLIAAPEGVAAHDESRVGTEDLEVGGLTAAGRFRRAGFVVADEEVVFDADPRDRARDTTEARLVLDEEPLAAVVVQVVAAVDDVIAGPDRLQAVAVVAVLTHTGDLVAFDQYADPVAVGVVVAVEANRVLAEGTDQLVVGDPRVVDLGRGGGTGVDAHIAAGDAVVIDAHPGRAGLHRDLI